MISNICKFITVLILFSVNVYAACDAPPANEVDWTNCNFIEQLDLSGVSLANAQMTGVNLALVNLEKSQINNANMSYGNFILGNFNNSNLFSSNMQYSNCNNTIFEVNFTGANIINAVFDEANLSNAIWVDGKKCALGSVGKCD